MQERLQRYGGYLAAMVLPNIGAILAWGLITAFVIPTGWTPNEQLAAIVGPMIAMRISIAMMNAKNATQAQTGTNVPRDVGQAGVGRDDADFRACGRGPQARD